MSVIPSVNISICQYLHMSVYRRRYTPRYTAIGVYRPTGGEGFNPCETIELADFGTGILDFGTGTGSNP